MADYDFQGKSREEIYWRTEYLRTVGPCARIFAELVSFRFSDRSTQELLSMILGITQRHTLCTVAYSSRRFKECMKPLDLSSPTALSTDESSQKLEQCLADNQIYEETNKLIALTNELQPIRHQVLSTLYAKYINKSSSTSDFVCEPELAVAERCLSKWQPQQTGDDTEYMPYECFRPVVNCNYCIAGSLCREALDSCVQKTLKKSPHATQIAAIEKCMLIDKKLSSCIQQHQRF